MSRPLFVLVDIAEDVGSALARAAQRRGLDVHRGEPEVGEIAASARVVACLMPVAGPLPAAAMTRIARVRRAVCGAPLVALVDRACMPTSGLAALGFHAAVDAASPVEKLAERSIHVGLAARRAVDLDLVGGSLAMARLREEIATAAAAPSHALLLGETGTGKGVAARALHALSPRHREPFETVDCASLSPALVESELFGHERGAFTGAHQRRRGRLERAASGTLFLDEIGELAPPQQAKLLRALEDRRFDRLGGGAPIALMARVVAATHRDLEADVRAGRFRRDLFYRLDVLRVHLPPLRDRLEDLPVLVDHLLLRIARRLDREPLSVSRALLDRLRASSWPGNVRELANRLEAMAVRSSGLVIGDSDMPAGRQGLAGTAVVQTEEERLAELLRECGGNVARVARRLGRPRSTVRYRIARLGLANLIPRD